jgi:hypothetical protein
MGLSSLLSSLLQKLPKDIQAAATVLGYTKVLWDKDKPSPTDEKDWEELTPEERMAAEKLGYDEKSWDDDDE